MGGLFWKDRNVSFSFGKKEIKLKTRLVPFWYEGFGLMFTKLNTAKSLLFSYKFSSRMTLFSSFIPYEFLAVWVNSGNKIVGMKIVKRGESGVEPGVKFNRLIEIPLSKKFSLVTSFLLKNISNFSKINFSVSE